MNVSRNSEFRILCVEDEIAIRRDIADELRECGFTVEEAGDGEAALEAVERQPPHLIISDIQMPRMDGRGLLATLRARQDDTADIPFIFLTAFGDRDSVLAGRREGADDYLVKPIDFDLLIAAAESHLVNARRRAARAAVVPVAVGARALGGLQDFTAALDEAPAGTPFAIVAIDNLLELAGRLGDQSSGHYVGFFRTVERLRKIRVFQLAPYKFGVMASSPMSGFQSMLARLVSCPLRDRTQSGRGRATLCSSIVTERTYPGMDPAEVLQQMRDAVRMLQREGGAQMIELQGPELATLQQSGAIRAELVDAIGLGQLTVRLQPKVRCEDSALIGAEVLVRWQSPRLGTLSPVTFIPILERAGLLHHVTNWVLRQAAICQRQLVERGMPARLAVNIGANEFDVDLPRRLRQICSEAGADHRLIELEITETTLMDDLVTSARVIDELRDSGVKVSLDDFGTGYSSLGYLRECHIDALKIDRAFVTSIVTNPVNQKIVEGIIEIGSKLGLDVIAEGVETTAQLEWLHSHGCNVMQGFLISEPLSPEEYYSFAARDRTPSKFDPGPDFVI